MMDEKCVMNSYFGIGIDAKITLDFHMKREEHPEKCRSRARNYMWYGVLGSKEWLQVSFRWQLRSFRLGSVGRDVESGQTSLTLSHFD
jgi:Diacylglycerol kinase accessory domain